MRKLFCIMIIISLACSLAGCVQQKDTQATESAPHSITAPAAGKLIGLIAEPGERISAGQPLFAVTSDALETEVKELQTQLAKAEAQLKRLEQGEPSAAPAADLGAVQARVSTAQQNAARMNALFAQGAVSRNQMQAAQTELTQATAALQAATQTVISSQPASPEAKATQQKLVNELQAKLAQKNKILEANEALSPCTGTITEVKAQNGAQVQQAQEILIIKEEK